MKTYEEMARDVLKRRDEELLKIQKTQSFNTFDAPPEVAYPAIPKKRKLLPKIAIPCAAAVLVGAVGVTVWRNVPHRGKYIQNGVETGAPENQHADIAPEGPYSVWVSDCHSGTPGSARETKINIVKLDGHPLGKNERADQIHEENLNFKFEPLTIEELNELYQIEFNRLSRLHTDWDMTYDRLGRTVRETPGVTTESYAVSSSREIISTSNTLTYKTPNGAEIEVTADRDFKTELSELGFSEEEFSVLGGYRAIVASASHDGEILYGAIIDMAGTNVQISAEGLSEDEFVQVLREYTECETPETSEDIIIIHDYIPEFFEEINPFNQNNSQYDPIKLTFEPISDINRYYGLEFDRLTKLRSDWQEQHIEFGIYSRYFEDEFSIGKEIVSTRNSIHYTLPNTAELYVTAMTGSLNLVTPGMPLVGERVYSRVNGCDAMIYRNGDLHNMRVYPNGNVKFGAVVEMGNAVLHFSAAGLTEEEFLGALRDFTAPNPEFDASQVIVDAVMPVPETADYGLTAVDAFDEETSFMVTLGKQTIGLEPNREYPYDVIMTEEGETASKYISEFFGTDIFPIDEQYKNSFRRLVGHGYFICDVEPKTTLISPVEGRVIGVNKLEAYSDLGFAVAVEFGDGNIFIATNLENVNVSVGETVTAGRVLGTCGDTGETVGYRLGLYLLKIFGRDE